MKLRIGGYTDFEAGENIIQLSTDNGTIREIRLTSEEEALVAVYLFRKMREKAEFLSRCNDLAALERTEVTIQ